MKKLKEEIDENQKKLNKSVSDKDFLEDLLKDCAQRFIGFRQSFQNGNGMDISFLNKTGYDEKSFQRFVLNNLFTKEQINNACLAESSTQENPLKSWDDEKVLQSFVEQHKKNLYKGPSSKQESGSIYFDKVFEALMSKIPYVRALVNYYNWDKSKYASQTVLELTKAEIKLSLGGIYPYFLKNSKGIPVAFDLRYSSELGQLALEVLASGITKSKSIQNILGTKYITRLNQLKQSVTSWKGSQDPLEDLEKQADTLTADQILMILSGHAEKTSVNHEKPPESGQVKKAKNILNIALNKPGSSKEKLIETLRIITAGSNDTLCRSDVEGTEIANKSVYQGQGLALMTLIPQN
jgi:hypothetical protein